MKPRRSRAKASNRRTPKRKPKPKPRLGAKRAKAAKTARRAKSAKRTRRRPRLERKTVAALEREVRRLRLARGRLERRLTAAVQEIGMLRQFEIRAQGLQTELARRDAEIDRLRRERDERPREIEVRIGAAPIGSTPS